MKTKSVIAVLVAAVFLLSLASLSFASGVKEMGVTGKVTKIEDDEVTVKDDMGKETTVDVEDVKDTKVGDKVMIKEGIIEKLTEKPVKSERPVKPGY
jgi:outer membrane lipoprotein SlyB